MFFFYIYFLIDRQKEEEEGLKKYLYKTATGLQSYPHDIRTGSARTKTIKRHGIPIPTISMCVPLCVPVCVPVCVWGGSSMYGRSRMTIHPRITTMPGLQTSGSHRTGRHCLHQARSAVRCSASRKKSELHATTSRSGSGPRCLVRTLVHMADSAERLNLLSGLAKSGDSNGYTMQLPRRCLIRLSPSTELRFSTRHNKI